MSAFTRKGFGRIYVENESLIENVKNIIKELDEFEAMYDRITSKIEAF